MSFEIHCANCGGEIDYRKRWINTLAKVAVCSMKCGEEVSRKYAEMLIALHATVPAEDWKH